MRALSCERKFARIDDDIVGQWSLEPPGCAVYAAETILKCPHINIDSPDTLSTNQPTSERHSVTNMDLSPDSTHVNHRTMILHWSYLLHQLKAIPEFHHPGALFSLSFISSRPVYK